MSTGQRIRFYREEKGISQNKLSKKVKVLNQSQIAKIELGMRKISDTDIKIIAEGLGVSVNALLFDNEDKGVNTNA